MLTSLLLLVALSVPEPSGHVSLGKVSASESVATVTQELKTQLGPLEGCFDLASKSTAGLKGALTLTFSVDPSRGLVTDIKPSADSLKDDTLVPCVMARLRATAWPVKDKPLTVTATFHFR